MMRPVDYLSDARDILLRKYSYKGSELEGLVHRIPREWRCMVGLHYPEYGTRPWSYFEPPEYAWQCAQCLDDVLPLRYRISEWFYSTRVGERCFDLWNAVDRRIRLWRGTWCGKHDYPIDPDYPCEGCKWGWDAL